MGRLSLTALRHNLFEVADRVLETGVPVIVERKGRKLLLCPDVPRSRLAGLKRRKLIRGDPETLVDDRVSAWREPENLA